MCGSQVVGHHHERVAVELHTAPQRLLDEVAAHGVVPVAVMLLQIINDGAFAGSQRSGYAYDFHDNGI